MSTILTLAEFVAEVDSMIDKVCSEEGIDKNEFLYDVLYAMTMGRPTPVKPYEETL
jgi:hypothetical protein